MIKMINNEGIGCGIISVNENKKWLIFVEGST